jgi:hypothetical protein
MPMTRWRPMLSLAEGDFQPTRLAPSSSGSLGVALLCVAIRSLLT